ncbi:MAG: hypothetical protein RBT51_07210 [Ectothiorhodospiraceae bacterium]|jgi:hypothetical protein|nr:hypothetical protein [Ectothiorhodospiraceae bacterium]
MSVRQPQPIGHSNNDDGLESRVDGMADRQFLSYYDQQKAAFRRSITWTLLMSVIFTAVAVFSITWLALGGGSPRALVAGSGDRDMNPAVAARLQQALRQMEQGGHDEAAGLFEALIAEQPQLIEAYNNLAVIRAGQGQVEEAERLLGLALQTDERFATVQRNLEAIRVSQARESYARGLRLDVDGQPLSLAAIGVGAASPAVELPLALPGRPVDGSGDGLADGPADGPAIEPVILAEARATAPVRVEATRPADVPRTTTELPLPPPSAPQGSAGASATPAAMPPPTPTIAPVAVPAAPPPPARPLVRDSIDAWIEAWSARDVERYVSHYAPDYAPEGMTRAAWIEERRVRLKRPAWIKIRIEDVTIRSQTDDEVSVRFKQRYSAPGYNDVSIKQMAFVLRDGKWLITSETAVVIQR